MIKTCLKMRCNALTLNMVLHILSLLCLHEASLHVQYVASSSYMYKHIFCTVPFKKWAIIIISFLSGSKSVFCYGHRQHILSAHVCMSLLYCQNLTIASLDNMFILSEQINPYC